MPVYICLLVLVRLRCVSRLDGDLFLSFEELEELGCSSLRRRATMRVEWDALS
jgi:hypothetical protein